MVFPRGGGKPRFFDAPAAFMWHALNAYENGGQIVADFVGYDAPDHFAPKNAMLYQIMQGKLGEARARKTPPLSYRLGAHVREEIVDSGPHEFPMVDPRAAMHNHKVGYMTAGRKLGRQHRRQTRRLSERRDAISISAPKAWQENRCSPPGLAPGGRRLADCSMSRWPVRTSFLCIVRCRPC